MSERRDRMTAPEIDREQVAGDEFTIRADQRVQDGAQAAITRTCLRGQLLDSLGVLVERLEDAVTDCGFGRQRPRETESEFHQPFRRRIRSDGCRCWNRAAGMIHLSSTVRYYELAPVAPSLAPIRNS